MSAAAWPALARCDSTQPTNVLALLLNEGTGLEEKLGAALTYCCMDAKAIAWRDIVLISIFCVDVRIPGSDYLTSKGVYGYEMSWI